MSNSCCIFGLTKGREKEILMFHFPSNETKCQSWLAAFDWKRSYTLLHCCCGDNEGGNRINVLVERGTSCNMECMA